MPDITRQQWNAYNAAIDQALLDNDRDALIKAYRDLTGEWPRATSISDAAYEVMRHKMIAFRPSLPLALRQQSHDWLTSHGFTPHNRERPE